MARRVACVAAVLVLFLSPSSSAISTPQEIQPQVNGIGQLVHFEDAAQADAEAMFADSEAAVWFPELRQVRALRVDRSESIEARRERVRDFGDALERDFPGYRSERYGPYLLKMPMRSTALPSQESDAIESDATTFSDGFEGSIANWTLANNTGGEYDFTVMGCKAHGGGWSADATRGGSRGQYLTCIDGYPANVITQITHAACDGIQGASEAWLDFWFTTDVDASEALGVYYVHSDGYIYGYGFTGTWSGWFHIILNLKQWNTLGDLTTASCPKVLFQFRSDATGTGGTGAFIDDVTIRTDAPSALRASITATPTRGAAPLTVSFTGNVSGSIGSDTYEWRFGDTASSTSTSKSATFTYSTAGEYWARFRVSDSSGARAYAHVKVVAESGSSCSVSCSASAAGAASVGTAVAFQASATASGCSGSTSYLWNFGDGQTSASQNPSHAYSAAGTYSWTMTASAGGTTCTKSGSITITASSSRVTKRRSVQPPKDVTVASGTIGATGGSVTGGGVSITVPPGAFTGSNSVTVSRTSTALTSEVLSSTFVVKGLPSTFASDLALSIDLDSTPTLASGEGVYVSFTGAAMNRDLTVRSVPFFIPATLSGRNVKATLPKSAGSGVFANASPGRIESLAYTGDIQREMKVVKKTSLETAHFSLVFPPAYASWASTAGVTLEQAFDRLVALGFSWGCRQKSGSFVKIPVYLGHLGTGEKDPYGEQNPRFDPCGTGWVFTDFINLNVDYDVSSTPMRASIAHEVFHFLQELYLPTSLTNPDRGLWMAEASSVWFETIFVPGSCPGVMAGSYQFPWNGLFNASTSAVEGEGRRQLQNHGYGVSALLKYRTDQSSVQNDPFVRSIWDSMKAGSNELEAIQNALGSSVPDFWTRFAKEYFTGRALPGCVSQTSASKTADIKDSATLQQTFKFNAYPLSSISFNFNLMGVTITDKTPLPIIAENLRDGQTVFIYDLKDKKELAQLTKTSNTYTIEDVVAAKGRIIAATFVDANLPGGSSASTNEVTITTGSTYKCYAQSKVAWYRTSNTICTAGCIIYDGSVSDHFIGSVTGDKFHAEEMYCQALPYFCRWRDDNATYTANINFTFTNKGSTIEGFSLETSLTTKYGGPGRQSVSVSVPVPLLSKDATHFDYKLTGPSVCTSVSSNNPLTLERTCDGNSFFLLTCEAYTPPKK